MWWLVRDVRAVPPGLGWLAPREIERVATLRFAKRRTEYLLRRLAAKHAVSAVLGLPVDPSRLAAIEIANEPSGAPFVLVNGAPPGLDLSLSDRAGLALCTVAPRVVGCDVELVEPRTGSFLRDYLTDAELAFVSGVPRGVVRDAAANLLWSAKESALKVLRTGLRRDTRTVEVTVARTRAGEWGALTVDAAGAGTLPGWWRRAGDFVLTVVCATGASAGPPVALEPGGYPFSAAIPRSSASMT